MTMMDSDEAEKGVLASCWNAPKVIPRVRESLAADDFRVEAHQVVFRLLHQAPKDDEEIEDLVINMQQYVSQKAPPQASELLLDLRTRLNDELGLNALRGIVKDGARRRHLKTIADRLRDEASSPSPDVDALCLEGAKQLTTLGQRDARKRGRLAIPLKEAADAFMTRLSSPTHEIPRWSWPEMGLEHPPPTDKRPVPILRTRSQADADKASGWSKTWTLLGGMVEDTCMHVVGRTGRGKTAWALTVMEGAARTNPDLPALYASVEIGSDELIARLLSIRSRSGTRWKSILQGQVKIDQVKAAVDELVEELPNFHVWTPPAPQRTGEALVRAVAEVSINSSYAPVLVTVDYLQRFVPSNVRDLRIATSDVSGRLRDISRPGSRGIWDRWPAGVPWPGGCVIALGSAPRSAYENLESVNTVMKLTASLLEGSGKESGSLEYDATVFAVLTSDPANEANHGVSAPGIFKVVKNRAGRNGHVEMRFHGGESRWSEISERRL